MARPRKTFGRLEYCQYLLSSQVNYTLTNYAENVSEISHDLVRLYLKRERLTASDVWRHVNPETEQFWVIDFRIFAPEKDGKGKADHIRDMINNAIFHKGILNAYQSPHT